MSELLRDFGAYPGMYRQDLPNSKKCPWKDCNRRYLKEKIIKGKPSCPVCGRPIHSDNYDL